MLAFDIYHQLKVDELVMRNVMGLSMSSPLIENFFLFSVSGCFWPHLDIKTISGDMGTHVDGSRTIKLNR